MTDSPKANKLPKPSAAAVFKPMAEGGVLFSSESEVYFGVNRVGAVIWDMLVSCDTLEEMIANLTARFRDVEPARISKDVNTFLSDLLANGLVESPPTDDASSAPVVEGNP